MSRLDHQHVFGQLVREMREQQGLTQEQLATSAGLHRTYISLLERGLRNPSLEVITRVAAGLGVKASVIIAQFEEKRGKD